MLNKRKVLHEVRISLEGGSLLSTALHRAGVKSKQTLQNWRKKSPRIDRFIRVCQDSADDKRTTAVEDAYFKKLISGEGSPTDYIFYLTNRRPERWKHTNTLVNVGVNVDANNTKIMTPHAVIFSAVREECETNMVKDECRK